MLLQGARKQYLHFYLSFSLSTFNLWVLFTLTSILSHQGRGDKCREGVVERSFAELRTSSEGLSLHCWRVPACSARL